MAKDKKATNDLSQLGNLFGNPKPVEPKKDSFNMQNYHELWKNKAPLDAFYIWDSKTPKYSEVLIHELEKEDFQPDNFALKLNKFAAWRPDDKGVYKFRFFGKFKNQNGRELKYEVREFYGLDNKGFKQLSDRHFENAKRLFNTEGYKGIESKDFKPDWRVVVGLGTDSVYETGIILHHIYGFPYIPASAIKGITNHYVLDLVKEAEDKKEETVIKDLKDTYLKVFGSTKQQGKITFFDAMPTSIPQLKPDIMNVHYPKYYGSGNEAPTDTQSPVPILFLTVEKTSFQFIVGCKEENKALLQTAFTWLESALKEKGIGAKTAVGYGYMK